MAATLHEVNRQRCRPPSPRAEVERIARDIAAKPDRETRTARWSNRQPAGWAEDDRGVDGASFVLDAPAELPAVWGDGAEVLWASREPSMIYGPQGVGKTTIAHQLVLARIGIGSGRVLGYSVARDERPVLYFAGDRPHQIRRSLARMVDEQHRVAIAAGLVVWPGTLPFDVIKAPERLAEFAAEYGAGTLVIDSLKDLAVGLNEDEKGSAINMALQRVIAAGIEVATLHHPRKATAQNPAPRSLDGVYGSTWLTAGHGSVIGLWGKPGDPIVELLHRKHPAHEVGPFKVIHDHDTGQSTRWQSTDLLDLVRGAFGGLTVKDAAGALYGGDPDANAVERARRKLNGLVTRGLAELRGPEGKVKQAGRYYAVEVSA